MRVILKTRYFVLAASTAMAICIAPGAQARAADEQPAGASEDSGASDIVVTARRREENILSVPVAVTAISGQSMERLNVNQVSDLRFVTPGLNVQPAAGRETNPVYLIRGQRPYDTILVQDPSTSVYVDEVLYGSTLGSNLGLFDLQNAQVLKGPQGTLFGRNSTGGAVLFETAKPTDAFEGRIKGWLGNYDQRGVEGMINIPLSEALKLRGAFLYTHKNGYAHIVDGPRNGKTLGGNKELSGRITLSIDPGNGFVSNTTAYANKADTEGSPFTLAGLNPLASSGFVFFPGIQSGFALQQARGIFKSGSEFNTGSRIRIWGVYNKTSVPLSDVITLNNIISYRHVNYFSGDDFDGLPVAGLQSNNIENSREFSEELQLQGTTLDGTLDYTAGVYYFRMTGVDETPVAYATNYPFRVGGDFRNSSIAGYGQATWATPVEGVSLTAGLRYTHDKRYINVRPQNYAVNDPTFLGNIPAACNLSSATVVYTLANCERSASTSFSKLTWNVSLDYKPGPDTLIYLAHRRGYRSGGFNARAQTDEQFEPFRPETVSDIEIGAKHNFDLGGARLRTTVAAYKQFYNDLQKGVTIQTGGTLTSAVVNAAKATIQGLEFDASADFGKWISVGFGYAYVDAKYKDFSTLATVGGVPGVLVDLSDRKFNGVPKHQINANVRIGLPVDESLGKIDLTASYYYQSSQYLSDQYQSVAQLRTIYPANLQAFIPDDAGGFRGPAYGLLNLRLDWREIGGSGFSAAVWAKNVTDKKYIASGISVIESLGFNSVVPGWRRTIAAELSYKF